MLSQFCVSSVRNFIRLGCFLRFYPFYYDKKTHRLEASSKINWFLHTIHRTILTFYCVFCFVRLGQAFSRRGYFPILPKILNIAWCGVYSLSTIASWQFRSKYQDILQYCNWLLAYLQTGLERKADLKTKEERKQEKYLGRYL